MSNNRYFEFGGEVCHNASREEWLAARESYDRVREWAESAQPVTFQQEWWRAVARPKFPDSHAADNGVVQAPRWELFAGEHADRHGVPYPAAAWNGEYVGTITGVAAPTAEAVAALVAEWAEGGAE